MNVIEGYMPYLGHKTYYRVVGDATPGKAPLLLLHGGPGSTHNYFEVLDPLAEATGRQLVMYDQIGCGNSYVEGEPELWAYATWDNELMALRRHLGLDRVHLLGQSWGGMLAIEYLCDYHPEGIASLILSSSLPSCELWAREQHRRIRYLPLPEQDAIERAERTGDYEDPAYLAAKDHYMTMFCSGPITRESPECLRRPKRSGDESYLATQGHNEFTATGIFSTWDYTDKISGITAPTLIVSGTDDLCSPLVAKTMFDRIPNARWELFEGCRHMCFVDDTPRYLGLMAEWLAEHD